MYFDCPARRGRWRTGTEAEQAEVAAELDASLQEAGFVAVVGHGVPDHLRATVRAAAMEDDLVGLVAVQQLVDPAAPVALAPSGDPVVDLTGAFLRAEPVDEIEKLALIPVRAM